MEAALFYSNRCNKCNELKQFKSYNNITKICVDSVSTRKRLPKYITSVPSIVINHKGNQKEVKVGDDVIKWFSLIDSSNISIQKINSSNEPLPHKIPSNNTQQQQNNNVSGGDDLVGTLCSGDMFSSGYSSLDSGLNDIGNNFCSNNFGYLEKNNTNTFSNVSENKVDTDFDKHMNKLKMEREQLFK